MRFVPKHAVAIGLRLTLAIACGAWVMALPSASAAGDAGAAAVSAPRLDLDAYAPSPLALREPEAVHHDGSAPTEEARCAGARCTKTAPSSAERWGNVGAFLGAGVLVAAAYVRTRGDDGLEDFLEPLYIGLAGVVGATVGGAIGGALGHAAAEGGAR